MRPLKGSRRLRRGVGRGRSKREPETETTHLQRGALDFYPDTIGVNDLVIVDTPDALLVADRAQKLATIVVRLRQANRKEYAQHLRNYRPWGYFDSLSIGPRFQVDLLHVKPGAKLSMRMHHHRSEHWVVVHGTAKVTVGDKQQSRVAICSCTGASLAISTRSHLRHAAV